MPRYEGTFVVCPLCGDPMPQTWTGKLRPAERRIYCGSCWFAAQTELVTLHLLNDPVGWRERLAREPEQIVGTVFAQPLVETKDTRPPAANHDEERTKPLLEYMNRPEIRPAHAKRLDSALGWRNGTASRLLLRAEQEKAVVLVKSGRRNTFTTTQRWNSPEFNEARLERSLQSARTGR